MPTSRAGLDKRLKWLATSERERAAWSMSTVGFGFGRKRSGNVGQDAGEGLEIGGGAFALTDESGTWGGIDFLHADAMVAEYEADKGEAWLKDTAKDKTPGIRAWFEKGERKNFRFAKPLEGIMTRAAAVGEGFGEEHVFFPARAILISHHRPEDPPINSTPIHDPGQGDGDWVGHMHNFTWVRPWVEDFCGGATTSGEPLYSALLNYTKSAGDNTGWGGVHHSDGEGVVSAEGWGYSRRGAPKHRIIDQIFRESIDIDRAIFGDGTNAWSAPVQFTRAAWKQGIKGPYITNPELRMNFGASHAHNCGGQRGGMWQWIDWALMREYSPPIDVPPEDPPTDDPPRDPPFEDDPPENPPGIVHNPDDPRFPAPVIKFPDYTRPSAATPNELEAPSEYGHPIPNGPDAPGEGYHGGDAIAETFAQEMDALWSLRYGFTEREWNENAPLAGHTIWGNVYENAARATQGPPWRPVKTTLENLSLDDDGYITGRSPAIGPGFRMVAPANIQLHHLYTDLNELPDEVPEFSDGVFAAPNVTTRWGMGAKTPNSAHFIRGFDIALDFSGDADNPDINITSRNATGGQGTGALKFNGTALGTGSGDISSGSNLTTDRVVKATGNKEIGTPHGLNLTDDTKDNPSDTIKLVTDTTFFLELESDTGIVLDPGEGNAVEVLGDITADNLGDRAFQDDGDDVDAAKVTATTADAAINQARGVDATKGPWEDVYYVDHSTAGTTSVETFLDIPIPTDNCVQLEIRITIVRSDNTSRTQSYVAYLRCENTSGTVTVGTATVVHNEDDSSGLTIAYTVSGTNARITVQDGGAVMRIGGKVSALRRNATA